jgi:hypothetical protein
MFLQNICSHTIHSAIPQKMAAFITTAVRILNPTKLFTWLEELLDRKVAAPV